MHIQNTISAGSLQRSSPLDLPLPVTFFADKAALTARAETTTLRELAGRVLTTTAAVKADLPWIKLARFGENRTIKHSLRNNANVEAISGVECDYDSETMTVDEAVARLRAAGIAALVYTSPSHTEFMPRWRVLAPCSALTPPDQREQLTGRVNAALGGVLAAESFTLSQAYYVGGVTFGEDRRAVLIDGAPIDTVQLEPVFPVQSVRKPIVLPELPPDASGADRAASALQAACAAFGAQGTDTGRHQILLSATNAVAPFILAGLLDQEDVAEAIADAMLDSGRAPNGGEVEDALRWTLQRGTAWTPPSDGSEFDCIPIAAPAVWPTKRLFTSRNFKLDAHSGYVVKKLIAPGDIGVILGHPGAGKSTLAPFLAYAVAQGREFFGLRTRAGRTLILAAEDMSGTKKRIAALGNRFGHTDDCAAVDVGDLRDVAERASIMEIVREYRPTLVILDTLAAGFAGIVENSAEGAGEVLAFARLLASTGAAVTLVHHPAKAGDGTPRGHSSINGAVHVVLTLAPDDVTDANTIVRGSMAKNRNGSTAWTLAFRKDVVELGRDVDGDAVTTTLPVPVDLTETRPASARLSTQQTAAFEILRARCSTAEQVAKSDLIDALMPLSSSPAAADKRRRGRELIRELAEKRVAVVTDGFVGLTEPNSGGT